METWKKRVIIGALWGFISTVGLSGQLATRPIDQVNTIYWIVYLPASLVARVVLIWPIFAIPMAILIVLVVGAVLD